MAVNRGRYRGYTQARKDSNKRYREQFSYLNVRMYAEDREAVKARAEDLGQSLNTYMIRLIEADLGRSLSYGNGAMKAEGDDATYNNEEEPVQP